MRTSEQPLPQKIFSKFLLHTKIKGGLLKLENTLITFISKYTKTQASLLSCESMHFLIASANSAMLNRYLDLCLFLPLLLACNRYRFFHFLYSQENPSLTFVHPGGGKWQVQSTQLWSCQYLWTHRVGTLLFLIGFSLTVQSCLDSLIDNH